MNTLGCFQTNQMLGQALPADNSRRQKKDFYGIRARRKEKRISSCLAEELKADIRHAVLLSYHEK